MTTTPPLIFVQNVNEKEHKEVHPKPSTLLCKTIKQQLQNNHKKKECKITKK
jgi:hypothetical protein